MAFELGLLSAVREIGAFGVDSGETLAGQGLGKFFSGVFKKDEGIMAPAFEDRLPSGHDTERAAIEQAFSMGLGFQTDGDGLVAREASEVAALVIDAFAIVLVKAFFGCIDEVEAKFDDLSIMHDFEAVAVVVAVFMEAATGESFKPGRGF